MADSKNLVEALTDEILRVTEIKKVYDKNNNLVSKTTTILPLFLKYNTMKLNVKFYFGVSNEIEEVEISAKNVPIERIERILDDLESGIYEYGLDSNNHYAVTFKPLYEYNGAGGQYFSAWQIKKIKCVTVMTKD